MSDTGVNPYVGDNPYLPEVLRAAHDGPWDLARRAKLVHQLAPQLSSDPRMLESLVRQPVADDDLAEQVVKTMGFVQASQEVEVLRSKKGDDKRRLWDNLPVERRRALQKAGFDPVAEFADPSGLGDALSDAARWTGRGLMGGLSAIARPLRGATQALRVARRIPNIPLVAGDLGETASERSNLKALQAREAGLYGEAVQQGLDPRQYGLWDPSRKDTFMSLWEQVGDPFLNFDPSDKLRAWDQVDNDLDTMAVALRMADGRAPDEIAAELGGEFGSDGFREAYQNLLGLAGDAKFQRAVQILSRGRVSPGRSLAKGIGIGPDEGLYSKVSGAADATVAMTIDPLLLAGKVSKVYRAARWGLELSDSAAVTSRLEKLVSPGLDARAAAGSASRRAVIDSARYEVELGKLKLNPFERKLVQISDHISTESYARLVQRDKSLTKVLFDLGRYSDELGTQGLDPSQVLGFFKDSSGLTNLARGRFGSNLRTGVEIPRVGRLGLVRSAAKLKLEETVDFLANDSTFIVGGLKKSGGLATASDIVAQSQLDLLQPFAKAFQRLTQQVPRGGELRLHAPETADELMRLLNTGLSQQQSRAYFDDFFRAPSTGARLATLESAFRGMFDELGVNATEAGREWAEGFVARHRQAYSATGNDVVLTAKGEARTGLWPDADRAFAIQIPNFRDLSLLSAQSKRLSLNYMLFGSVPASMADSFMGVWRPSVLMRLGFIPRAAGEEALAFIFRASPSALGQAVVSSVARRPNEELLLPFRVAHRALTWGVDREVLSSGSNMEQFAHVLEGLNDRQQWLGMMLTPTVRGAARSLASVFPEGAERLAASEDVYRYKRKLQAMKATKERGLAEEFLAPGQRVVTPQGVVNQEAQAKLVRGLQNKEQRLAWAKALAVDPTVMRSFAEGYGTVMATEGANLLEGAQQGATSQLRNATVMLDGPGRRIQKIVLRPPGSEFATSAITDELGMKNYLWRTRRLQDDRAARAGMEAASIYIDSDVADAAFKAVTSTADGLTNPRGNSVTNGMEFVREVRRAWEQAPDAVRFPLRQYLKDRDPEALTRARIALQSMGPVEAGWLSLVMKNIEKLGDDLVNMALVDAASVGRGLPKGVVEALEAGDAASLDVAMRNAMSRRLSMPDMADAVSDHRRSIYTSDGRVVDKPVPDDASRVYTLMVNSDDARALAMMHSGDQAFAQITDPRIRAALREAAGFTDVDRANGLITLNQQMGRSGFVPYTGWATTDPDLIQGMAAALESVRPTVRSTGVQVGRVDVLSKDVRRMGRELRPGMLALDDGLLVRVDPSPEATSLVDAMGDWSEKLTQELKDLMFSRQTNKPLHAVLRPALDNELDMNHLVNVLSDLPLEVSAPIRTPYHEGFMQKIVRYGFDKVISPSIDAIVREPMFIESYMRSMGDLGYLDDVFVDKGLLQRGDGVAERHGLTREQLRTAWGRVPDELRGEDVSLARLKKSDKVPQPIKDLHPKELGLMRRWDQHLSQVERHKVDIAVERAVNEMIPFIDDGRVRSQMQLYIRHLVPFQFAEEQFLKRWARTLKYTPEAMRRAQLYVGGIRHMGFVQKNEFGEDVYILPGTSAAQTVLSKVAEKVTGKPMTIPVAAPLTGQLKYTVPGFDNFGVPSTGPLVGLSMKALRQTFPELQQPLLDVEQKLAGERGTDRSYLDMILPATAMRFSRALLSDSDRDAQMMSAQAAAIRYMAANNLDDYDESDPASVDHYLDRVRNWTRINFILRGAVGFVAPASPSVEIPTLQPEFKKMLQDGQKAGLPFEEIVSGFLSRYPDATPHTVFGTRGTAKTGVPYTEQSFSFMQDHNEFLDGHKKAAAYFIPEAGEDAFSRQAFRQAMKLGLRERKAPKEIVEEIAYREAADQYFRSQDAKETALARLPEGDSRRRQVEEGWAEWKQEFYNTHPLFARLLQSNTAHEDRLAILEDVKAALGDPRVPSGVQTNDISSLVLGYERFKLSYGSLAFDRRKAALQRKRDLRIGFDNWARSFTQDREVAKALYLRVVRPEIRGLPDLED